MSSILVVEDDDAIREAVRRGLTDRGHAVLAAATGLAGLETVLADRPDVVLLDLGLPDVDGLTLISMIRAASQVPIIVITAQDDDPTMVTALDRGADDYVVKPFGTEQVAARIRAVLRRGGRAEIAEPIRVGDLVIDEGTRSATLEGRRLELARKEFDLLLALAQRQGRVASKRELLAEVWQQSYGGAERTVDVHLSWLRRKLGETAAEPALPGQRARGRRAPGRPGRCLMRRRISWLVVATTSAVIVSFVIPLCLLVRTLAEDRGIAAADQEARNVAILVAGLHDDPQLEELVEGLDQRGAPSTSVITVTAGCSARVPQRSATTPRCSVPPRARGSRSLDDEGGRVLLPVVVEDGTAVVRSSVEEEELRRGVVRGMGRHHRHGPLPARARPAHRDPPRTAGQRTAPPGGGCCPPPARRRPLRARWSDRGPRRPRSSRAPSTAWPSAPASCLPPSAPPSVTSRTACALP